MSSFHGAELESLTVSGIRCRTTAFAPHFATRPHTHDEAYFCLVVDGNSAQRSGTVDRCRERGRVYFYPAGEVQRERFGSGGGRLFSIELGAAALAQLRDEVRLPGVSSELVGLAAITARRLYRESRRNNSLDVEELTMVLLAALAQQCCDSIQWAPTVRDYLHAHFAQRVTLRQIAGAAGVHPVHLCRAFPQRFGVTIGDYLRALRVDYAARQLSSTDRPIAHIALDAGFSSQSHLTREIKRLMGTTPAAYRRC